jgi:hypothetical protein
MVAGDMVELGGDKFSIRYDRYCGLAQAGRIFVVVKGLEPPTRFDVGELLNSLDQLAKDRRYQSSEGVIAVLDLRLMIWPSVLSIPHILGVLGERSMPAAIRGNTFGIAIVQAGSAWLGPCISLILNLLKSQIVPVCASTPEEADELLSGSLPHLPGSGLTSG